MSIEVQSLVWKHYPGAGNELLLALRLADHCNDLGEGIFAKVRTLAAATRQSERNVKRQLGSMVSSGWLVVSKHAEGGRGHAREFSVNPSWLANPTLKLDGSMSAFVDPVKPGAREESVQETEQEKEGIKGDKMSPFTALKGDILSPFNAERVTPRVIKGDTSVTLYEPCIYTRTINNHNAGVRAQTNAFDDWWKNAWPASEHKTRKRYCERIWQEAHLDAEAALIVQHTRAVIVGSEKALRDGGQYLMGPRTYLQDAPWREWRGDGAAAKVVACCDGCGGANAGFRRGAKSLCVTCFRVEG